MSAIGKVEYRMHNKFTGLYREGILFAKVDTKGLYLFNKDVLIKVDHSLDKEAFNTELQKAYITCSNRELNKEIIVYKTH
jgi:hypothetical protein